MHSPETVAAMGGRGSRRAALSVFGPWRENTNRSGLTQRRKVAERLQQFALGFSLAIVFCSAFASQAVSQQFGPATEKRFPPLTVPEGFRVTLFACDPLVEYPSVIAIGRKPGELFVAHDYVTGLGVEIVRRDEIRILSDSDGDGYADQSQLFAKGFNSIQGLAYDQGIVYVMHAPLLTALRDKDGDGAADDRRDLIQGLGLPPEENSNRLHCANGIVVGWDGWLYLALGDRGCDVQRPEGDRLLFQEGGILRCRSDGTDLHVFASGLRNIYDVALDAELNVFVRDNENDGGDYMIRVCHSFHGADHGYPYLYRENPDEAIRPLADLGRGSSAGGVAYLETAFPKPLRNRLFFCEWGRAIVTYENKRAAASFEAMQEADFAAGAANDPYGFKPTDVVVDYDGSLLVSDWGDGQRPKRGRGRIYRISPAKGESQTLQLDLTQASDQRLMQLLNSESHHQRTAAQHAIAARLSVDDERGRRLLGDLIAACDSQSITPLGRLHAIWIVAASKKPLASRVEQLLRIAKKDPDARVKAQAIRAIGDLADPVLVERRLAAWRGDASLADQIATLAADEGPRVMLEAMNALGRLRWREATDWLAKHWKSDDPARNHAAMMLLRRADDWPSVLALLDLSNVRTLLEQPAQTRELRAIVVRSLAGQYDATVVDGLMQRLATDSNPQHRRDYVALLARVYKRPEPWVYWGFRPAPRPANTVAWERSTAIHRALNRALADPDHSVRRETLDRMSREQIAPPLERLTAWLTVEKDPKHVAAILNALPAFPFEQIQPQLVALITSAKRDDLNRLAALRQWMKEVPRDDEQRLLELAGRVEDGRVLAALISALGERSGEKANELLRQGLTSASADVRVAALHAVGKRRMADAADQVAALLDDSERSVRRAAADVAGQLRLKQAAKPLLELAVGDDAILRRVALRSLQTLGNAEAVPAALKGLGEPESQQQAIRYLGQFGSAEHAAAVAEVVKTNRSLEVIAAAAAAMDRWSGDSRSEPPQRLRIRHSIAELHGYTGMPLVWSTNGPFARAAASEALDAINSAPAKDLTSWTTRVARGADATLGFKRTDAKDESIWIAFCDVHVARPTRAQFLASAAGRIDVYLNGRRIHQRGGVAFRANSDRFEAELQSGVNRLVVQLNSRDKSPRFHLRFREVSSKQEHERVTQLLLTSRGNVERGREVFLNAEKSQCAKCHRLRDDGGRIGPDLTGLGSRFSRIHLIESILQPSRSIAPSYATTVVRLADGRVVTGVKSEESPDVIVLGDREGKLHRVPRSEIEETRSDKLSVMPDGLEQRLTDRELIDLIAFLVSQKKEAK